MSKEEGVEERVYTINLGKVTLAPDNRRAKRAINMIREFAIRHVKSEEVKIDEELNEIIWSRGIRSPPRKIRVIISKDVSGVVTVKPYIQKGEGENK
jgi:Ribosomal protein L31E